MQTWHHKLHEILQTTVFHNLHELLISCSGVNDSDCCSVLQDLSCHAVNMHYYLVMLL